MGVGECVCVTYRAVLQGCKIVGWSQQFVSQLKETVINIHSKTLVQCTIESNILLVV